MRDWIATFARRACMARIDFREIFGPLIVFAAHWFAIGVGSFTFVQ
jgi:hypothetical protein